MSVEKGTPLGSVKTKGTELAVEHLLKSREWSGDGTRA